uniref:CRT1 n=1 Tax=Arundo donax TaxID=35708 RepID=A0A0A9EY03_ARUDO
MTLSMPRSLQRRPGASTKMLRRLPLTRPRKRGLRRNLQRLKTTTMTTQLMKMMWKTTRLILPLRRPRTLLMRNPRTARPLLMRSRRTARMLLLTRRNMMSSRECG